MRCVMRQSYGRGPPAGYRTATAPLPHAPELWVAEIRLIGPVENDVFRCRRRNAYRAIVQTVAHLRLEHVGESGHRFDRAADVAVHRCNIDRCEIVYRI